MQKEKFKTWNNWKCFTKLTSRLNVSVNLFLIVQLMKFSSSCIRAERLLRDKFTLFITCDDNRGGNFHFQQFSFKLKLKWMPQKIDINCAEVVLSTVNRYLPPRHEYWARFSVKTKFKTGRRRKNQVNINRSEGKTCKNKKRIKFFGLESAGSGEYFRVFFGCREHFNIILVVASLFSSFRQDFF